MPRAARQKAETPGSTLLSQVVGRNVAQLRRRRYLPQTLLGERLRALGHPVPGRSLGFLENGQRNLTVDELLGLALALGVTIPELLATSETIAVGPGLVLPGESVSDIASGRLRVRIEDGALSFEMGQNLPGGTEAAMRLARWLEEQAGPKGRASA